MEFLVSLTFTARGIHWTVVFCYSHVSVSVCTRCLRTSSLRRGCMLYGNTTTQSVYREIRDRFSTKTPEILRYRELGSISNQIDELRTTRVTSPYPIASPRITNSNTKLGGVEKIGSLCACEVMVTSLHVPPTHLRTDQALVEAPGTSISLRVSCLRGKPVDTSASWRPNAANSVQGTPVSRHSGRVQAPLIRTATTTLALPRVSEDLAL